MSISAVVIGKNAQAHLEACLQSVAFADEIIFFDIRSTDNSVEIARQFTTHITIADKEYGFVEPLRNQALRLASKDWTLLLDTDEEIPSSLAKYLQEIAVTPANTAYFLPRKNLFHGYFLQHTGWWPDYQLRFFPTGKVSWPEKIHGQPQLTLSSRNLPIKEDLAIIHHNYPDTSEYLRRFNNYTDIEAEQQIAALTSDQRSTWHLTPAALLKTFSDDFLRRLFQQQGYQDGTRGLYLSILQAAYQMSVQMKMAEQLHKDLPATPAEIRQFTQALTQFQKDYNYWVADLQIKEHSGLGKIFAMIKRKLGL